MNKKYFNKSQRMQMKAMICVLGFLLILLLLIVKLILVLQPEEEGSEQEIHIPVVEQLMNVWIMEADSEGVLIFREGMEERHSYWIVPQENVAEKNNNPELLREQLADIELTDGLITDIQIKSEKITGKILSRDTSGVELEGYGRLEFSDTCKGYRIYNTLTMCTVADLAVGYQFADFVLEEGEICGILIAREEAMEYIRVLIKASDYSGLYHEQLIVTSDTNFTVEYGAYDNRQVEQYSAGEEIVIDRTSRLLNDRVIVTPDVLTGKVILNNIHRSQGVPSYRGQVELMLTKDGIIAVNEVSLEEYLYSVVPSEMPASYPKEALKAQAICARTYAYGYMQNAGYPQYGAHVDDSTSYQVYNNILEQESTTTAVKETYGQLLFTAEGIPASTYYYSTSCGVGTDANVWKTESAKQITYLRGKAINRTEVERYILSGGTTANVGTEEYASMLDMGELLKDENAFRKFITSTNTEDFEVGEGWYRWSYTVNSVNVERMLEVLKSRYQVNSKLILTYKEGEYVSEPIEAFARITNLYICKRGSGGVGDELILETDGNTYKVISEYNIRAVLNDGVSQVLRQDGSMVNAPTLLPSAYFVLTPVVAQDVVTGYTLTGGGYGHGVGMSQNGAKNMANSGYTSEQILTFFYEDCAVQNVYNRDEIE